MIVVPVFMIVYYRFAGVVAVVALMLNLLLLIASMALLQASFTLPGLAGLALTIGMAVDVNVLIFERMREEAERGADDGPADPQRLQPGLGDDLRLARHDLPLGPGALLRRRPTRSRGSPSR